MEIVTTQARAHHGATSALGILLALAVPIAVVAAGVAGVGLGGISWSAAIVGGVIGAWAFAATDLAARRAGLTHVDLLDLLGSVLALPGTRASRALGLVASSVNGALLAVAWAYGVRLAGASPNWITGLAGAFVLWALSLVLLSSTGAVHPAVRRGVQADPGPLALELGQLMPLVSFVGHAAYGVVLGAIYAVWPS